MSARPGGPRLLVTTPFLRLFSLPSCPLTWSPTEQVALVVQRGRGGDGGRLRRAAAAVPPLARHARTDRRDHAVCQAGCNPTHPELQPRAPRPATPCTQACSPRTQRVAACDRAQPSPCRRRRSRRCFARAATCRRAEASRWAASRASRGRRALMRARGCSPTNARLQPYQSMHTAAPSVRALSVLYIRSARPSSSRRCARRWASSSITLPNPSPRP